MAGDTRAIPIQNGNGNGKAVASLIQWIIGLLFPILILAGSVLAAKVYADSERVRDCEVRIEVQSESLREIKADLKEVLRRLEK